MEGVVRVYSTLHYKPIAWLVVNPAICYCPGQCWRRFCVICGYIVPQENECFIVYKYMSFCKHAINDEKNRVWSLELLLFNATFKWVPKVWRQWPNGDITMFHKNHRSFGSKWDHEIPVIADMILIYLYKWFFYGGGADTVTTMKMLYVSGKGITPKTFY